MRPGSPQNSDLGVKRPHCQITKSTSRDYIPGIATTLAKSFALDPVTIYLLNHVPWYLRSAALYYMQRMASFAAYTQRGEFWEASTNAAASSPASLAPAFHSVAIILPPGRSLDNASAFDFFKAAFHGGLIRMFRYTGIFALSRKSGWTRTVAAVKKDTFAPGETYYYVLQLGTLEKHRGRGLAGAIMKELQGTARTEGKCIWLEASEAGAREMYKKYGFVDVDVDLVIGKGECDKSGEKAEGQNATGVRLWLMIWRP